MSILLVGAVLGAIALVAGILAYTGRWRTWARRPSSHLGFVLFWAGLGFVLLDLALVMNLLRWPRVLDVVGLLGALSIWVAIVCWFWVPPFLRPSWFRDRTGMR